MRDRAWQHRWLRIERMIRSTLNTRWDNATWPGEGDAEAGARRAEGPARRVVELTGKTRRAKTGNENTAGSIALPKSESHEACSGSLESRQFPWQTQRAQEIGAYRDCRSGLRRPPHRLMDV